jgi:hypothetical protein
MSDIDDFISALALAILFGVSIVVILEILKELSRGNQPANRENISRELRDRGYL